MRGTIGSTYKQGKCVLVPDRLSSLFWGKKQTTPAHCSAARRFQPSKTRPMRDEREREREEQREQNIFSREDDDMVEDGDEIAKSTVTFLSITIYT